MTNVENYAIFEALPGTRARAIIDELQAQRIAARDSRAAFSQKHGAEGTYGNDSGVVGILFPSNATLPDGWRSMERSGEHIVAVPARKTPAGKALAKEMAKLPALNDGHWFSAKLGCGGVVRGRTWLLCTYRPVGDRVFVMIPLKLESDEPEKAPEGCPRVPLSAYFAAKEADTSAD